MTLDECIKYLENVSAEKTVRSRKVRQILKYLQELKHIKESNPQRYWEDAIDHLFPRQAILKRGKENE